MKLNIEKITKIIKEKSLRVTKPRLAVARVLLNEKSKYLTSEEIYFKISNIEGVTCDLVSVYRILATFEEIGIIKKTELYKEATRYILQDSICDSGSRHEHFFKCTQCFTIEAFSDCFVSKKEKELETSGYRNLTHHLEISGLCPTCAA
jgi:Fe2+ or Zn2+ uptake regulation protein